MSQSSFTLSFFSFLAFLLVFSDSSHFAISGVRDGT